MNIETEIQPDGTVRITVDGADVVALPQTHRNWLREETYKRERVTAGIATAEHGVRRVMVTARGVTDEVTQERGSFTTLTPKLRGHSMRVHIISAAEEAFDAIESVVEVTAGVRDFTTQGDRAVAVSLTNTWGVTVTGVVVDHKHGGLGFGMGSGSRNLRDLPERELIFDAARKAFDSNSLQVSRVDVDQHGDRFVTVTVDGASGTAVEGKTADRYLRLSDSLMRGTTREVRDNIREAAKEAFDAPT